MSSGNHHKAAPSDGSRLIHEALSCLGWSANPDQVAEEVRRLDIGLPLEDQFSVICAWLGKCEILHKLDQVQVPVSSKLDFQVPDLLAKFSTQTNHTPLLIEVKSKKHGVLSFKPDYLRRLQNYADLLGMPLLIAWKFHSVWMLFEARHLKKTVKNFSITLNEAMRENILGSLAGDIAYKVGVGTGLHFQLAKNELLAVEGALGEQREQWRVTVEDVYFTDHCGNRRVDIDKEVVSLFAAWDLTTREGHSDTHIDMAFVMSDERIQFAHMSLVPLLNWESDDDAPLHWRKMLRRERVTESISSFSDALSLALEQRVISHIFHLEPNSMPVFLQRSGGAITTSVATDYA